MLEQSQVGAWVKSASALTAEHLECPARAFYGFKTQFTAGRAVHVGLLGSAALKGL